MQLSIRLPISAKPETCPAKSMGNPFQAVSETLKQLFDNKRYVAFTLLFAPIAVTTLVFSLLLLNGLIFLTSWLIHQGVSNF